jgi:hypothetical protein
MLMHESIAASMSGIEAKRSSGFFAVARLMSAAT